MLEEPHVPQRRDKARPTKNCKDIYKRCMGNIPAIFWNPLKSPYHLLCQDNLSTLQRILNDLMKTANRLIFRIVQPLKKVKTIYT